MNPKTEFAIQNSKSPGTVPGSSGEESAAH
jgi:hypothetical protein